MYFDLGIGENYAPELRHLLSAGIQIFDDSWCTYVPTHKTELQEKIIRRYFFNQIGAETPERFVHYLNEHLSRVMPFYNQLYASELIEFDPMLSHYLHSEGTDIDTMVKLANTASSKVGNKLRDFVLANEEAGKNVGSLQSSIDKNRQGSYNKSGNDDVTDNTDTQNKTTSEATTDTTTDQTGKKTTENTDTKNTTQSTTTDSTEKMVDTTSQTTAYSDTPQKNVGTGAVRLDYLTNYTAVNGNETKDTTSKVTGSLTEEVAGSFNGNEDTTQNTTQNVQSNESEDFTGSEDRTIKKQWDEQGTDTETTGTTQNDNTTATSSAHQFQTQRDDTVSSDAEATNQEEKSASENKRENVVKGYINITPSQMLKAFRETFLRIDEMILNDLRDNFMEIY